MMKNFRKFISAVSVMLFIPITFNSVAALTADTSNTVALPESYSSVDKGYITSVKDQGDTGTCWVHAAIAACEASLIKNNGFSTDLNLSELNAAYTANYTQSDKLGLLDSERFPLLDFIQDGGDYSNIMMALANWNGAVTEEANHCQYTSDKLFLSNANEFDVYNKKSQYSYDVAHLTDGNVILGSDVENIKKNLLDYAAGATHINIKYYNYDTCAYYAPVYEAVSREEHGVAIVGWDDNFPKENCSVDGFMPDNDGAWLIKNSWGTDYGIDGYMWVSYEDEVVKNEGVTFFKFESADNYTYNYAYDDLTGKYSLNNELDCSVGNDVKMANVFTAMGNNEQLEAVSFFTMNSNLNYEADVYLNLSQNSLPIEGKLVSSVSGKVTTKGYHTIKLDRPVSLNKGEKFSIVIRLFSDNPDDSVKISIDLQQEHQELLVNKDIKVSEFGESFYCIDNINWTDLKSTANGNVRIKAFTHADVESEPEVDEYSAYNGYTRQQLFEMLENDITKSSDYTDSQYKYTFNSITKLRNMINYAEEVTENKDLFLAVEIYGLHKKINNLMSNMEPFTMAEDLQELYKEVVFAPHYQSVNEFDDFISIYNEAVEKSEQGLIDDSNYFYYYEKTAKQYKKFMVAAISNGYKFSFLQKFGDANHDSVINVNDVTYIQKLLAGLADEDFYSHYNSDVDANESINISDATAIQRFLCMKDDHLAAYDNDFNKIDNYDSNITKDESKKYLQQALQVVETSSVFSYMNDSLQTHDIVLNMVYNDGKQAFENADSHKAYELLFKARNILRLFNNSGKG